MSNEKKLFLLDAYALIFRAYYAFINRPIRNSKGLNTSAVFGFVSTLDEVLRVEQPTHIAVAFDPPSPTFRHQMYEEYKANREATPPDIKLAVPYIKQILEYYNIPILEYEGFEADDVIGTMAKKAARSGFEVFMMTPDKDFAQLVSEHISMYKPGRGGGAPEVLGPDEVKEKFLVEHPEQVNDVLDKFLRDMFIVATVRSEKSQKWQPQWKYWINASHTHIGAPLLLMLKLWSKRYFAL